MTDFIATTNVNNPVLSPKPTEYDVHVYQTPSVFLSGLLNVKILICNQLGLARIHSSTTILLYVYILLRRFAY
jgi:hypothetical protein